MAQLEFRCEKCGKLLRVMAQGGDQVICSHCGQQVTAPQVSPRPRPMPQVMGGARPQPMVNGQPGQQPAVMTMPEQVEPEEGDSLLAAMSFLMPWALSIVFHIGLLLVLLFMMTAGQADPELEDIAVPSHVWSDDPGVKSPNKSDANEAMEKIQNVDLNQPAPEVKDTTPTEEVAIVAVSNSSNVATMKGAFSGEKGNKGSKFFGQRAGGNTKRIIFVVDSSGSMNKNFDYVKKELKQSISELGPMQEFTIIFFSDGKPIEMLLDGQRGLINANRPNIKAAQEWVMGHIAQSKGGKTLPAEAVKRAFQFLGSQPGLIWILTDGLINDNTEQEIASLNTKKQVHVNTLGFVDHIPDGEKLMRRIAAENGGKYKFVSLDELTRQ